MCKSTECQNCKNNNQNGIGVSKLPSPWGPIISEKKENKPYSFVEDIKERDRIHAGLINLISRYAIDNGMTLKAIDECMEQIKELYYNDAMIRKGE